MNVLVRGPALAAAIFLCVGTSFALDSAESAWKQIANLPWQTAPAIGDIGGVAQIKLNRIYYLGKDDTKTFLKLHGNPEFDNSYAIRPKDSAWFAVLDYQDSGHVKDDETIDADALLETLKAQNVDSRAERKRLGLPVLVLDDWAIKPHYDAASKRLEWGTRLHDEATGEVVMNYTARLLGRTGMINAILVSNPEMLKANVRAFHAALAGFSYNPGRTYGEYTQGDKLAGYGLAALIAGGAAAAASKSGLLKGVGMAVIAGVLAIGGAIAAFFRKLFRRQNV